jgi:hypothetical protein
VPLETKKTRRKESPMKDRLGELEKRAERAVSRAVARERRLYSYGQPLYDYEKHQRLLREIRQERNRVLAEVERAAREVAQEQQAIEAARHFPRDSVLSSSERREALERLPLISAEITAMDEAGVAKRLETVAAEGDKVTAYAHWQAAVGRRTKALSRQEQAGVDYPTISFGRQLDRLDRALFETEFVRRTEDATDTLEAARKVEKLAYTRRRNATSSAGAYAHERYSITPLIERQRYEGGGKVQVAAPGGAEPPTGEL